MYFRTSSFTDSLPCFSSNKMLAAVNCFEVDPMSNTDFGAIATPSSIFANPYPFE